MDTSAELKIVNKYFKGQFPFVLEVTDAGPSYNISPHRLRLHSLERPQEFELLEIGMYISPTHFCELMDHRIEEKVNRRMKLLMSTFLKSVFTDWKGTELRLLFFPEINEQTILNQLESTSEES
jgi:hypothetical protein